MGTTSQILPTDYAIQMVPWMIKAFSDAQANAYQMIWDMYIPVLLHNWLLVLGVLFAILLLAFLEFLLTGRWASLGRVLYSYLHGTVFLAFGFIFGPKIYANDFFDLINFGIYVVCFIAVGKILDGSGIRRRYR